MTMKSFFLKLKAICARCFPPDTLLADLTTIHNEQTRKVMNYEIDLISIRLNLAKEKAKLRYYTKELAKLNR